MAQKNNTFDNHPRYSPPQYKTNHTLPKRRYRPKANAKEWLLRLISSLLLFLLAGLGSFSYANTGTLIPRRELLTGNASFHFIDVGQGDATLILTADTAVLIDAGTGSSAGALVTYLKTYTGRLDYLILTHPHDDHVGGVMEILERMPVERILMPLVPGDDYTEKLLSQAEEMDIPVTDAKAGAQYYIGDLTCTLLGPVHTDYNNLNDVSAVVRVDVGNISALFTGDAEQTAEEDVLAYNAPALLDCDIYHVGHHGSSTSTSLPFYTAISPDHCVISCGYGNSYGHPHTTVTSLLTMSGATVYRTDKSGTIILETDGETITQRHMEFWETELAS